MGPFYCEICRQTSFAGKGHVYEKKHKERLKAILGKFRQKIEMARKLVKAPSVLKYDFSEHEENFWCYCCGQEVKKHTTNGDITVLYGGLLEHLASLEHRKQTNKFWWENKAEAKLKEKFLFSAEDYKRFKSEVSKTLESYEDQEDEFIKQEAACIREVEQRRQEVLQSALEPPPEQDLPNGTTLVSDTLSQSESFRLNHSHSTRGEERAGPSGLQTETDPDWLPGGQNLTFIGHQEMPRKGNIHTGATPPWLVDEDGESDSREIGPSYEEFLRQKEKEKLRKLPPNRVGANFDHTSQTDGGWLPSFGRVWNNGRRWQSRHQFRAEEDTRGKRKRKSSNQGNSKPGGF
ncbi:coiled-coil domain-containing protein 84 isoform X2 [Latimeria chalumnae]|uniref:coiled-coil domain-containing protein 84 isoform X2 n=1 Tax=Latimeria chalumnae TaxID=7897 RepID=UPI0006D8DD14|nr:PREDICTED: coiled-coil domain-containing protein 84 [Latimeria chalumnae]|eukprot:XP_014350671.1 PREDICTED: coiled-coil domain-containing protein 84 [Latimeria chalumnae]